jgi:hypothetical protein
MKEEYLNEYRHDRLVRGYGKFFVVVLSKKIISKGTRGEWKGIYKT